MLAAATPRRPDWMSQALCTQTDPEAFFPGKGGSTREAKQVCAGCDVRAALGVDLDTARIVRGEV